MIFAILLLFSGRDREFYSFKIQILFLGQQQKLLTRDGKGGRFWHYESFVTILENFPEMAALLTARIVG